MKAIFYILSIVIVWSLTACGSSGSSSGDAATSTSTLVTLTPTASSLALGGNTTIAATGESGSYVSATASEGTLVLLTAGVYSYTAPSSTSSTYATISVTDSLGNIGYTYISVAGTTTTTTTTGVLSCAGTYDVNISGIPAVFYLTSDTSLNVAGYVYIQNYYYPVVGSCQVGGTLSLTNLSLGQIYSASVALTTYNQVYLSGSMSRLGSTYAFAALSRLTAASLTSPNSACEGTYSAVIAGSAGTMVLVGDGNLKVAGYLYLQGYYYALAGTCTGLGGTITMTNLTSGSLYNGVVSSAGVLSGTFTTSSATYGWSATK